MMKKIITNFKVSLILLIIAFCFIWYVDGILEAKTLITEYWWIWLLLPFALRLLNWFLNMKQKAFNYGAKSSEKNIEGLATLVDKATNTSKKRYDTLKQNTVFNAKDAEIFRNMRTEESIKMEIEMTRDSNFFIPLYRFEKGLPGKNLVRSSLAEIPVIAAKIKNGNIEFYECEVKDYDASIPINKKISELPLGSIIKIEIVDLTETRVLRKVGGHLTDKATKAFVNVVSSGVKADKQLVDAACLNLHYINEDGILIKAEFVFPSNCKLGKKSIKILSQLNSCVGKLNLLGKLNWNSESIPAEDINDDGFDLDDVSSLTGDMITVLKWINLLSDSDSAILSAKLSAEMIAGVLQDDKVELIETTDIEKNKII